MREGAKRRDGRLIKQLSASTWAFALFVGGATEASAQTAPTSTSATSDDARRDDDIVVTAQKRTERLNEVPISISVLRGAQLDGSSSTGVVEALSNVPAVSVIEGFNGSPQISIRGVSTSTYIGAGSSPVGYYLDSVPFAFVRSSVIPDANAYDLDRIEVLRGPQGTLYGASALNGVVRVLTHDADPSRVEVKARGQVASIDAGGIDYRGDVAVNLPLVADKIAARGVISYQRLGGWIDRPALGEKDANDGSVFTGRFKLGGSLGKFTFGALAWISRDRRDNHSGSSNGRTSPITITEPQSIDYDVFGFKAGYDAGPFAITSSTSYINYRFDSSFLSILNVPASQNLRAKTFTQELNLNSQGSGSWRWTAGAIYRDSKDQVETIIPAFAAFPGTSQNRSESFAVFGEITKTFFDDKLRVTGGLRYFHDNVAVDELSRLTAVQPATYVHGSAKFHALTPRFVVTWIPNRDFTAYVSYGQGFRSGALQSTGLVAAGLPPTAPDKLTNYEVGLKGDLLDNAISYDISLFYSRWTDVQRSFYTLGTGNIYYLGLFNSPSASGIGTDISVTLRPVQGLSLTASAGLNGLEMDKDVVSNSVLLFTKGERLDSSPSTTLSGSAEYKFAVGGGLSANVGASASYVSSQRAKTQSGTVVTSITSDNNFTLRASAGIDSRSGWSLSVFADNLTNENRITFPSNPNDRLAVRSKPRTIGLQFNIKM